jgi:hypothetical protein
MTHILNEYDTNLLNLLLIKEYISFNVYRLAFNNSRSLTGILKLTSSSNLIEENVYLNNSITIKY